MRLTEVFARKTYGDPDNESEQLAKDYIRYAKDGPISGADFRIVLHGPGKEEHDHVVIYQETDESEDGEEEADKYIVGRSDIRPALWRNFLKVAKANSPEQEQDDDYWAKENERIKAGEDDYRAERATKRLYKPGR